MRLATIFVAGLTLSLIPAALNAWQDREPDLPTRLKSIKGPFTMLVHLEAKKGKEKDLIEIAKPCIAATLKEPGCVAYELIQDQENPTKFVFFEKWKSVKDLETHLAEEHTRKLGGAMGPMLAGPGKFTFFSSTEGR